MNRIRVIGVGLVAVFAMSVGASAAFGASEFKTEKFPVTFTGTGGIAKFESTGKEFVECEKSKSKGEVKGALEAKVTVEYSGKCHAEGPKLKATCSEPIVTKELKVQPGDEIGKVGAGKEPGQLFTPKEGAVVAEPKCLVTIKVKGSLVCASPTAGKLSTSGETACKETAAGAQEFTAIKIGTEARKTGLALVAEAPFVETEKEAQITTEKLTFSAAVEQSL
jgi:hypothetical protein